MAIEASAILPSDSLEEFRVQFNNLVSDVAGVSGGNSFVSTIIFEGSTADANETVILAIDPQQDNTLSLPDVTGTFLTTGNSGDPATTTAAADADHVLVNDGGVLKKITRANLGIGGTAGAVAVDDLTAGDAAVSIATTAGNITIDAQGGNTDIIFKGTDGSSDITPMTLDMSDAGAILLTGGKIDLKNAGTASQILFYCESSNAHAQTLQSAPHSQAADNTLLLPDGGNGTLLSTVSTATVTNKTLTAPVINTATVGTSITPASDDGATLGSANLNWSDLFLADAAVIKLGDDQDVTLTHVHGTGILLNSTNVIQFNDASQNIGAPSNAILDINATDEIELNATLIDINGNVEISGTATTTGVHTFTAVPVFPNNTVETADIQADAITGAKIADDAINSEHYTDGSIDTAHIAADQIVASLIADNAINSEHYTDGSIDKEHLSAGAKTEVIAIACGDETTATAAATAVVTFHMPYAFTLTGVKAGVTTAPVGSVLTVDINEAGTTILSTKITIDASEKTSGTAATAAVISDTALADNALMTIDVDGVGSGTAGAGLKVYLIGHVT